jgi:hypothetical protein
VIQLHFIKKIGYNVFNFEKFSRFVLVLNDEKTIEISEYINQNSQYLIENKKDINTTENLEIENKVIEITIDNIDNFSLNLEEEFSELTTTKRDKEFLKWRFLKNPFINYLLFGVVNENSIIAYIALREEELKPFNYKVNRIIDLFGKQNIIKTLLNKTLLNSLEKKHIYIDFSMFGSIYENELLSFNFLKLENENYTILPQVTSPIENRPNNEFLGIYSKEFSNEINKLTKANVYFTRMDSDRDRKALINS